MYDAVEVFGAERFDLVFTGIGALCWLPDIARWGQRGRATAAPGRSALPPRGSSGALVAGRSPTGRTAGDHTPYFEQPEPTVWDEEGTYVSTDHQFGNTVSHDWSHGLAEVVTSVLDAGLVVTELTEHDTVPWNARPGEMVENDGEWRMRDRPERFPCSYTLQAAKP